MTNSKSSLKSLLNQEERDKELRIKSHEAISKPKRKRITPYQLNVLMELFKKNDTPNYQLREATALKLSMTNREVQVWFQNRRAKVNRNRLEAMRQQDTYYYSMGWPSHHHYQQPIYHYNHSKMSYQEEPYLDSQSSTSSSNSSTPTLYPQTLPHMKPIDILALAAEYVQRCDEEQHLNEEKRENWRPWD
ncbi:hypothetical protein K501DRAFT_218943 [Backusella circina FSU 941]|nr:hypothetical protein K501DRAFT_218943 [Backusella circina FSU 941]